MTAVGFSVAEGPLEGTAAMRLTVPEKPLRLCRVTVKLEDEPWLMLREAWLAVMVKSGPT